MSDLSNLRGQALFDALLTLSKTSTAPLQKPYRPYIPPSDPWIEHGLALICTIQTCTFCGHRHPVNSPNLYLIRTKRRGGLREFHGLAEIEVAIHEGQAQHVVYRHMEIPRCVGCFEGEEIEL